MLYVYKPNSLFLHLPVHLLCLIDSLYVDIYKRPWIPDSPFSTYMLPASPGPRQCSLSPDTMPSHLDHKLFLWVPIPPFLHCSSCNLVQCPHVLSPTCFHLFALGFYISHQGSVLFHNSPQICLSLRINCSLFISPCTPKWIPNQSIGFSESEVRLKACVFNKNLWDYNIGVPLC